MKWNKKRLIKWILWLCLTPVGLAILSVLVLYIPAVQHAVIQRLLQSISASTGLNVHAEKVQVSFPLHVRADAVSVTDAMQDTLIYCGRIEVGVQPLPLLKDEIVPGDIHLEDARFDTKSLIRDVILKGTFDHLHLHVSRIHLRREEMLLDDLFLSDAHLTLCIDSSQQVDDETDTPVNWQLMLGKIHLKRTAFDCRIAPDSIRIGSFFDDVLATDGHADLRNRRYTVRRCIISADSAQFHRGDAPPANGPDLSHIRLSAMQLTADSILYADNEMNAVVRRFSVSEQSGLKITEASGALHSDSVTIVIPYCSLRTPYSAFSAQLSVPWQLLSARPEGSFYASFSASIDRRDAFILANHASEMLKQSFPDTLLLCAGLLEGDENSMYIRKMYGELAGVFRVEASGVVEKITDPSARSGHVTLAATTSDATALQTFVRQISNGRLRLPDNLQIDVQTTLNRGTYNLEMLLAEQQGKIHVAGSYHPIHQTYSVKMEIDSLEPIHFLPSDSLMWLKASLRAEGAGTHPFDTSTWLQLEGALPEIQYGNTLLTGFSFDASLKNNRLQALLRSAYPQVSGEVTVDGIVREKDVAGMLIMNVDSLNLPEWKWMEQSFTHSFQVFSEFESDLDKRHKLDITLGNWEMRGRRQTLRPKTLTLRADSKADHSLVSFHTGDLSIMLNGKSDLNTLAGELAETCADVVRQFETDTTLDVSQLHRLPEANLKIEAQRDNPIYNYLQDNDIFFDRFELDASLSSQNGLQVNASLYDFIKDTTKIDTLRLQIYQDSAALHYAGLAVKNKFRNQEPFKAYCSGEIHDSRIDAEMLYRNGRGETGLHIGVNARKTASGIALQVFPERPILAFLPFRVNADNYIHINSLSDISANLQFSGENNASIALRSLEEANVMQELSFEINGISLDKISGKTGNWPSMQGEANFSLRYVPMNNTYMLVADAGVDNLFYQGGRIGELLLSGVYMPLNAQEHQIDLHFFHDRKEISGFSMLYKPSRLVNRLEGRWEINNVPLQMFNPFLGNSMRLNGALQGGLRISGTSEAPLFNGFMQLDTATAYVAAAGTHIRFDGQKIAVDDSKVTFNKYNLFAVGDNPFVINGFIDMRDPMKSVANLKLTANEMQLFNAPKTDESIVYGKMTVNLNSTVNGALNALKMKGDVYLNESTNMGYILKESPLAASDRMADLVEFSYFRDTIPRRTRLVMNRTPREFTSVSGFDALLTMHIDPAVKLKVDLDKTGNDRIEMKGGGDLSLQFTSQGEMLLTGRYTFTEGLIKYTMPVIANKTLAIKENSYVEWAGNPLDPYLNLKAVERIRSSVSTNGEAAHAVNFEAGIALKQQMNNLDLQFTLEALDDAIVRNQLIAMGAEERSKQAVSMLLTGMYLASDGTGKTRLNMNTALNAFLQSEINHLSNNLLKGVDFNFGMESFDDMAGLGGKRTDYLFRFSKRFYDDRFNIMLGGQVSTGDMSEDNYSDMFINNASLEYRLDTEGNRYAKLFYNRQYESLLEGEISKYGAGIIFRRKMRRLHDMFIFRKKQTQTSIDNETNESAR